MWRVVDAMMIRHQHQLCCAAKWIQSEIPRKFKWKTCNFMQHTLYIIYLCLDMPWLCHFFRVGQDFFRERGGCCPPSSSQSILLMQSVVELPLSKAFLLGFLWLPNHTCAPTEFPKGGINIKSTSRWNHHFLCETCRRWNHQFCTFFKGWFLQGGDAQVWLLQQS